MTAAFSVLQCVSLVKNIAAVMAQKMNNASVADEINNSAADALFIISYIKIKVRFQ